MPRHLEAVPESVALEFGEVMRAALVVEKFGWREWGYLHGRPSGVFVEAVTVFQDELSGVISEHQHGA